MRFVRAIGLMAPDACGASLLAEGAVVWSASDRAIDAAPRLHARPRRRRLPPDRPAAGPAPSLRMCSIAALTRMHPIANGWPTSRMSGPPRGGSTSQRSSIFSRRVVGWSMSAATTTQLVTDALVMAIWRRGKPDALLHHSDRGSQGGFKWSSQRLMRSDDDQMEAAIGSFRESSIALARSTASGRANELRRFWAAIASGLSSEDAATSPPTYPKQSERDGSGRPAECHQQCSGPRQSRSLADIFRLPNAKEIALLRAQGCTGAGGSASIGRAASTISRELRRNAATRSGGYGVSRDDSAMACRASSPSTKAGEACAERGLAGLCPGPAGGAGRRSERRFGSWPVGVLERATTGTRQDGDGRVPGALSRSPDACRSTSRTTRPCASATRPSTRRCSSKGEARCGAS